jgi:transposase-like protein
VDHRNGYRERRWDTKVGAIDLRIPKLGHGSFFPALASGASAALGMYADQRDRRGLRRRCVDPEGRAPVEALGIDGSSKSQVSEIAKSLDAIVDEFRNRAPADLEYPQAARLLEDAAPDRLAFTAFPRAILRHIWSNNPLEKLTKEIRRRTNVVCTFPNRDSVIRLVGASPCEQNDEWCVGRRYMGLSTLAAVPRLNETLLSLPGKEGALEPFAAQA